MATTTEELSLEQLIATFGEEVGKQMYGQLSANKGGGGAPFPYLKKVSTHGSAAGAFGDFVYGVKTEKDPAGKKTIVDKGTNLGTEFEFIIVNVCYRYTLWDEGKQKSYRSNIFNSLDGIKTAVDSYTGKPLPASKEDKKAADWKLNRINTGLVRKNSKSPWVPVIFETSGTMYFTLGELLKPHANGGLLAGIAHLKMTLDSKGSTQYSVVDVANSSFVAPLPITIFSNAETKDMISDITTKMTEYQKQNQYDGAKPTSYTGGANVSRTPIAQEDEHTEW